MTHVSDFSDEQIDGFVILLESFLEARPDTFSAMDQAFDSAAESDAAKKGWTAAISGLSLIVATAHITRAKEAEKNKDAIS